MKRGLVFLAGLWLSGAGVAVGAADVELESRIGALLERMTLEQKVGQMIQAEIAHVTPDDIRKYRLGSVLNGGGSHPGGKRHASPSDWLALADALHAASVSPVPEGVAIPLLWGTDAVHGHNNVHGATLFPHNIGLGAANDSDLVRRIGEATALEVVATGIGWTFAPTLAVARNDRWGRTYESFSEDPEVVARLGTAMVEGLQGAHTDGDFLGPRRVLATAKHFIGDGATQDGADQGDVLLDQATLVEQHGAGYPSTIAAGVQTVMVSFNSVNGVKVHGSRELITGVLKEQMGFDGLVVSDWNGVGQVPGCTNASCPQAINAGIDMVMVPEDWKAFRDNLLAQVRDGTVPLARIDDAVRRILRVKARSGLLDANLPSARAATLPRDIIGSPGHRELAREAVRRSLVLLKNDDGLLPLSPRARVFVGGDGADDIGKQAGGWTLSWQGTGNTRQDFPGASSVLDGVRRAVDAVGGRVVTGNDPWQVPTEALDAAIVVFGEDPYAEGQGDRESLDFSAVRPEALRLMNGLRAAGVPVVAVFLTGRPLWVNPELNAADAFVVAWLPGSEGAGVADVLFAGADGEPRFDFQGRLSFSWPVSSLPEPVNEGDDTALFGPGFGLDYAAAATPWSTLDETRHAATANSAGVYSIFDARPVPPWNLFVGDPGNWRVPVAGAGGQSVQGNVTVTRIDRFIQEDSLRVTWTGNGQLYFQSAAPRDLGPATVAGGALSMILRVIEPPKGRVELRMDCVYPCGAKADLSRALRQAPRGEWFRLAFQLNCFAGSGARMNSIDTPLLLTTDKTLVVDLAEARIVTGEDAAGAVQCRAP